jgi:peptidoglycan/xylan/chitin deacetylase (PgdA/CDA1 family)
MTSRSNGNLRGPQLSVLLYHNVGPLVPGTNRWLTVAPRRFQQQVRWLARHGYCGISAQQWLAHLRGQAELPRKPVMLTFDDGYRALGEHAFPVLEEYGFRAVVFIVTRLIGKTNAWDEAKGDVPMALLTADELRYWSQRGIEFGAHSRTHADLRQLGERELSDEVAGSRVDLEKTLGREVCSFAYPYGFWNDNVRAEVARNFPLCFSVDGKLNDSTTDPLHIRRTMVLPLDTTTDIRFRAAMGWSPRAGMLSIAADLRNRILRRPPYDR